MYWDPYDEIRRMHEEMDRMFQRAFGGFGYDNTPLLEDSSRKGLQKPLKRKPMCHVQETESQVIATFELPGVRKEDIELFVYDDHMEIKVESKQERKDKSKEGQGSSYSFQQNSFYRSMSLPKEVDSGKAKAEYKNGVLRVVAPKKHSDDDKRRRLKIE